MRYKAKGVCEMCVIQGKMNRKGINTNKKEPGKNVWESKRKGPVGVWGTKLIGKGVAGNRHTREKGRQKEEKVNQNICTKMQEMQNKNKNECNACVCVCGQGKRTKGQTKKANHKPIIKPKPIPKPAQRTTQTCACAAC